jgi:general secretion pathway protein D
VTGWIEGCRPRRRPAIGRRGRSIGAAVAILAALALLGCDRRPLQAVGQPTQLSDTATQPHTVGAPRARQSLSSEPGPANAPMLLPGTGIVLQPPSPAAPVAVADETGDIRMNFVDADVREVAHSVLGDVLHLNYAIDAKLQATLTVQTDQPLRREDVLPAFEEVLRASGLTLVEAAGIYRIVPLDDAARSGAPAIVLGQDGPQSPPTRARYEVRIVPLKFVSACRSLLRSRSSWSALARWA